MNVHEVRQLADLNYREALREQCRRCGGVVEERDGLLLAAGVHAHPAVNTAIRVSPELKAEEAVRRAREFFRKREQGFMLSVKVGSEDDDIVQAATADGWVSLVSPPAMVVDATITDKPVADEVGTL